jgi:hypothetical protein
LIPLADAMNVQKNKTENNVINTTFRQGQALLKAQKPFSYENGFYFYFYFK